MSSKRKLNNILLRDCLSRRFPSMNFFKKINFELDVDQSLFAMWAKRSHSEDIMDCMNTFVVLVEMFQSTIDSIYDFISIEDFTPVVVTCLLMRDSSIFTRYGSSAFCHIVEAYEQ
jgi:hypothetical protein